MAEEERSGVQNVWLLLIALGLGLIVVVIYNVHIYRVRQEGRGQTIRLLRVTRDLEPGDKIGVDDVVVKPVAKQYQSSLGSVVDAENLDFAIGSTVNTAVGKDQWLQWGHITDTGTKSDNEISPGNVGLGVPLDSRMVPGDILRPNARVHIVGLLPVGGSLKTFRIIEGVRVVAVAGAGLQPAKTMDRAARAEKGPRSYRSISIEVAQDVSLEFANVLTHVSGSCWVELVSSRERNSKNWGRINPLLKELAAQPSRPLKGEDYE
jgi:hypothetical protein